MPKYPNSAERGIILAFRQLGADHFEDFLVTERAIISSRDEINFTVSAIAINEIRDGIADFTHFAANPVLSGPKHTLERR